MFLTPRGLRQVCHCELSVNMAPGVAVPAVEVTAAPPGVALMVMLVALVTLMI
jgi:hypothetical protein